MLNNTPYHLHESDIHKNRASALNLKVLPILHTVVFGTFNFLHISGAILFSNSYINI